MDAELRRALAAAVPNVVVPHSIQDLPRMRASMAARGASDGDIGACGYERRPDLLATRDDGGQVRVMHLHPERAGRVPVVVYLHGGGGIAGTSRTGLVAALLWADQVGAAVLSVNYRLAPEHRSPAAATDCVSVLQLLREDDLARRLDLDLDRLCLVGVSGGAHVAAGAMALIASDPQRRHALPTALMLLYPMLDHTCTGATAHEHGHGLWDAEASRFAWQCLLGPTTSTTSRGTEFVSRPLTAPSRTLRAWPRTWVETGGLDPLRSDGLALLGRLERSGAPGSHHHWPEAYHCVDQVASDAALSGEIREARSAWLRRGWNPEASSAGKRCPRGLDGGESDGFTTG